MEVEIRFTIHARERMRELEITEDEVRDALARVRHRRIDPRVILAWGMTRRGRRIKIVLDREDPRWVVTLAGRGKGG